MRRPAQVMLLLIVTAGVVAGLKYRMGSVPPLGKLFDPADGLYRTARGAQHAAAETLRLATLQDSVTVLRDQRGVPHIFAQSGPDAAAALGYLVAQDRLFQLDFLPRVVQGRLAAVFGPDAVSSDRFLRRTGMERGARRSWARIREEGGIEKELIEAYVAGVNTYTQHLTPAELPFEFRMLGYEPDPYTPLDVLRILEYMTFDLTYGTDEPAYTALQKELGAAYQQLYPRFSELVVPIIPPGSRRRERSRQAADASAAPTLTSRIGQRPVRPDVAEGFQPGKGSNNWAVGPQRSATGEAILAGDMHLGLTLPSIWYEVHLVTPRMNTYGVAVPGSPLPITAFNERVAWSFTNTGADQIDHYKIELDSSGTRYCFEDGWRDLQIDVDTLQVAGADPVLDTVRYTHWGPIIEGNPPTAIQWVGHEPSSTLRALWGMNHARNETDVQDALRFWDTPMQNVLVADTGGTISIRSTGLLPVRQAGHGVGLLDGSTDDFAWTGRVPFEDLPYARKPEQGFLTSTNQQPTDSTYPYYLGHNWQDAYRSLRIDSLLRRKERHTVRDLKRYQADVHAVQRDLFVPLLDTLTGLSARADTLRRLLARWNGETTTDRPEPLILKVFMDNLKEMAWDEVVFLGRPPPESSRLYDLLTEHPQARWLDVLATPETEQASGLLRRALRAAVDTLDARYGWGRDRWRWGAHHKIVFQHLTRSDRLRPLWRGPAEYPGFRATLSPAKSLRTTHSASWRMVVDFSGSPPVGYGVYPGGQSGNPFSALYDLHLPTYLDFSYYRLLKPAAPDALADDQVRSRLTLRPASP